jgi:hypothetical protein
MGRLGDLLELLETAPVGVRTLTGSLWRWTHYERARRAVEELTRSEGGSVTQMHMIVGSGPRPDERDEHLRLWLVLPDRWRIESSDRLDLKDGDQRWIGGLHRITSAEHDDSRVDQTELGMLVEPGSHLLGGLRFGTPIEDSIDGRPCWKSDASTNAGPRHRRIPLGVRLGGIDHTFWFDAETGIVMRHLGLVDGEPCSIAELKDVVINQPIPDETFRFVPPPDAVVERQIDGILRMAESRGVDLTDVDRSDLGAVRAAVESMGRPHHPPAQARLKLQRAKHVPVDRPPADEAAARSAIEYAYAHYLDADEAGEVLVNVQGGRGLATYLQQAGQRIPGSPQGEAKLIVDDVKFLRPDEAVVWFSLEIDGKRLGFVNGREGRAVMVSGKWMIEHATIVDLVGMAGVEVPPPSP